MNTRITRLTFPALRLPTRDAHKLRGYFGRAFREHSALLHNHLEDGSLRYGYPLVQYKVVDGVPTIVGLGEGAELLIGLFREIREIKIAGRTLRADDKELRVDRVRAAFRSDDLLRYAFTTLYMPFSAEVYQRYKVLESDVERTAFIKKSLQGHLLMAFKGLDIRLQPSERIMVSPALSATTTLFKNQRMLAYRGEFTTNVELPDLIGVGRSTSRGFGTIQRLS